MRRKLTLATAATAVALASALILTGCGSSKSSSSATAKPKSTSTAAATAEATADPAAACKIASGSESSSVKVSGDQSAAPKVTFSSPLKSTAEQRTVLIKGSGEQAAAGRTVDIGFQGFDGTTGKAIGSSFGYDKSSPVPFIVGDSSMIPGLTDAIACEPVGSRVVYTAPAADAFGASNLSSNGLKKTDSVVFVADILSIMPNKATGAAQAPKAGFPTVTLAADGTPTLTIPKGATPPSTTQIEVLKKGTGPAVKDGDTVTVQYQGTNWRTGKIFDESWGTMHGGAPSTPASFATNQVVAGFSKALVGQTVGSQVVVEIPPVDGYGASGDSDAGIKGTDTIVFVIDILATAATASQ